MLMTVGLITEWSVLLCPKQMKQGKEMQRRMNNEQLKEKGIKNKRSASFK